MAYNPIQTFEPQTGGGLWEWLFGSPERLQQIQQFNPQQQQAFSKILQMSLGGLGGLESGLPKIDYSGFEPIEADARAQFSEQGIPSIAERFTSMGGQGSGAFARQLGSAQAGLERGIGALKAQYGLGQQQLGLTERGMRQGMFQNLLGAGLTPQAQNLYRPAGGGFIPELLKAGAHGVGQAAGMAAMGGI